MHNSARRSLLAVALLCAPAAFAQAEQLEVSFDLAPYTHPGSWSFSRGCTHNPPTGRMNWVHITVVWLEDMNGNYVTTLHRWGRSYLYDLKAWTAAAGPGLDGVTSATPTSDPALGATAQQAMVFKTFTTGVRDISKLPDGQYRVRLESTQCELADDWRTTPSPNPFAGGTAFGPTATFTFTKGRTSQSNATLGSTAPFNNVRVNYTVPAGNAPPGVSAGPDQWRMPSMTPAEATTTLTGTVTDPDTTPPTVQWTLASSKPAGLGAAIASPTSATTQVTFTQAGVYTFRLTATDSGGLTSSDDVVVNVNARVLRTTDDAEVNSNNANTAMGTIDVSGPWTWAWGPDTGNRSRAYLRFDLTGITGQVTYAALQLRWAELAPTATLFHDFHILTDAQDDLNGAANSSTDYEATLTWNNQPVPQGLASNLAANQLAGSLAHPVCNFRHAFTNPDLNPGEAATVCPGRFDVPLNLTNIAANDQNKVWSFFMAPRPAMNNGLGLASDENTYSSELLVVQYWQSGPNQAPVANAGTYATVKDASPPLGAEAVTFDGSGSTDDAMVTTYEWREGSVLLGASNTPRGVTTALALGEHTIELTARDGAGLSDTATAQVLVEDRFEPNHARAQAAAVTGAGTGQTYGDLFANTSGAAGDWYAVDLVAGSNLTVAITMPGGNLDLAVTDQAGTVLQSAATANLTETVTVTGAAAGRHYIHVEAASGGASTYSMAVTTSGGLTVALNPSSGLENAGTLSGAGTVSLQSPAAAPVTVTLTSSQPAQLGFGASNTVTIPMGATSATFDVALVDDPAGVPDTSRLVTITASATGVNSGSADFQILDNEAAVFVAWDKVAETASEAASPTLQLKAVLSGPAAGQVVVPFTITGTATRGTDFSTPIAGGQLTISGGTSATYLISVLDDADVDPDETVIVTMGTPTGASLGSASTYTLTITDDESGSGTDGGTGPGPVAGACGCTQASGPWLLSLALLLLAASLGRRRARG